MKQYDQIRRCMKDLSRLVDSAERDHRLIVSNVLTSQGDLLTPAYGTELILDMHDVDSAMFTRETIDNFFEQICTLLGVERCDRHFWDEEGIPEHERATNPNHIGITAVQFLLASNIIVHTLTSLGAVFINVFVCGPLDQDNVESFCRSFWKTHNCTVTLVDRLLNPEHCNESLSPRRSSILDNVSDI